MNVFKTLFFNFFVITVTTATKTEGKGCILPSHPSFGWWSYINQPSVKSPGLQVPERAILLMNCDDSYRLDGCKSAVCINGTWIPHLGQCLKTCSSIYSTHSLKVTCNYKGYETVNCTEPIEGTLAEFKCASFYEDTRLSKSKALCLKGKWSEKIPECDPVCGRVIIRKKPTLIIRADKTKKGEFPWQIAIYTVENKLLICGGSLLSERVVLTAAHCLTDNYDNQMSKNKFLVVAGKYYRKFDHPDDDHYSQVSEIQDMFLSEKYEGDDQNFQGDIAIIITIKFFTFSPRVQPVCIDWSRKLENVVFGAVKQRGYVSGWGNTRENSDPANELKSLQVPAISRKECQKLLPDIFRRYMTHDKFCAGYKNNGTSVCIGDSGGGLVFKKEGRFFIAGVVSLAPTANTEEGGCDSQQYTLYTLVYNYTDNFILEKITEFKISDTDVRDCKNCTTTTTTTESSVNTLRPRPSPDTCMLPHHPENGRWSVLGHSSKYSPGDFVTEGTTLNITCNEQYKYFDAKFITCLGEDGWTSRIGQCRKKCPDLTNLRNLQVSCSFNNRKENCSAAYEGAIAKFECEPFYSFSSLNTKPSVCIKGQWNDIPKCVPNCGQMTTNDVYVPWGVTVFIRNNTRLNFECEGSLISDTLVLTVARCITNSRGELRSVEEFAVATGKHKFSDFITLNFSRVAKMFKHSGLQSDVPYSVGDIGLMALDKRLKLSEVVQPVCLDWADTIRFHYISIEGLVIAWDLVNTSKERKKYKIKTLTPKEFMDKVSPDLRMYGSFEKLFGTILSNDSETSFGKGASGAGLVFKHENKYYLGGVLTSIALTPVEREESQPNQIYLFTTVAAYVDHFIRFIDVMYRN